VNAKRFVETLWAKANVKHFCQALWVALLNTGEPKTDLPPSAGGNRAAAPQPPAPLLHRPDQPSSSLRSHFLGQPLQAPDKTDEISSRPSTRRVLAVVTLVCLALFAYAGTAAAVDQFLPGLGPVFYIGLFIAVIGVFLVRETIREDEEKKDLDHEQKPPRAKDDTGAWGTLLALAAVILVSLSAMLWEMFLTRLEIQQCPPPTEIVVLTTTDGQAAAEQALESYAEAQARQHGNECRTVTAEVFTTGLGAAQDRELLIGGWDEDALAHGPRPDVWIPDSLADVNLVREQAGNGFLGASVPAWYTPLVMLHPTEDEPEPRHASRADAWDELTSDEVAGARARPSDSTGALLFTERFHFEVGDPELVEEEMTRYPVTAAGETGLACAVRRHLAETGMDAEPRPAVFTTERAALDLSRGASLGAQCPEENAPDHGYEAVYVEGVPGLDHPVTPLRWENGGTVSEAEDFTRWLNEHRLDDDTFAIPPGYRDWNGDPSPVACQTPGLLCEQVHVQRAAPDQTSRLAATITSAGESRRPGHTLLVLDTSDSMQWPLANQRPAFSLAVEQITSLAEDIDDAGIPGDQLALWTFPAGGDVEATDMHEVVDFDSPSAAAPDIRSELADLDADRESTPLNDAVLEAALALDAEQDPDTDAAATALIFTEGIVGSGPGESGSSVAAVAEEAADALNGGVRVELVMLDPGGGGAGAPRGPRSPEG
jgi:hypothetical protein